MILPRRFHCLYHRPCVCVCVCATDCVCVYADAGAGGIRKSSQNHDALGGRSNKPSQQQGNSLSLSLSLSSLTQHTIGGKEGGKRGKSRGMRRPSAASGSRNKQGGRGLYIYIYNLAIYLSLTHTHTTPIGNIHGNMFGGSDDDSEEDISDMDSSDGEVEIAGDSEDMFGMDEGEELTHAHTYIISDILHTHTHTHRSEEEIGDDDDDDGMGF